MLKDLSRKRSSGNDVQCLTTMGNPTDHLRISYCGDLTLLKDQVAAGYDHVSKLYRFDTVLSGVKEHWAKKDLVVGVCEGPFAGEDVGYSNTDLHDGLRPISFNFPDAFAFAMADAGIGLVTVANNHILDKGTDGGARTLKVLASVGIDAIGYYSDRRDGNAIKLIEMKGVKLAFLAYTYGCNYRDGAELLDEGHVKVLLPMRHPRHLDSVRMVERDFETARRVGADFVVVLPHLGTEFRHFPDAQQRRWCDFFVKHGADLVLGAHSHNTQPIVWYGKSVVVYSPGNLINSFVDRDVDAGMLVDIDVDVATRKIARVSFSPTICHRGATDYYVSMLYDLRTSVDGRVEQVCRLVTKSVSGTEVRLADALPSYVVTRRRLWFMSDLMRVGLNVIRALKNRVFNLVRKGCRHLGC